MPLAGEERNSKQTTDKYARSTMMKEQISQSSSTAGPPGLSVAAAQGQEGVPGGGDSLCTGPEENADGLSGQPPSGTNVSNNDGYYCFTAVRPRERESNSIMGCWRKFGRKILKVKEFIASFIFLFVVPIHILCPFLSCMFILFFFVGVFAYDTLLVLCYTCR